MSTVNRNPQETYTKTCTHKETALYSPYIAPASDEETTSFRKPEPQVLNPRPGYPDPPTPPRLKNRICSSNGLPDSTFSRRAFQPPPVASMGYLCFNERIRRFSGGAMGTSQKLRGLHKDSACCRGAVHSAPSNAQRFGSLFEYPPKPRLHCVYAGRI